MMETSKKLNPILYNKKAAWIITWIMVIFAVLAGGSSSLKRLRAEAQHVYDYGDSSYEFGIYDGLNLLASSSLELGTIAERYDDEEQFPVYELANAYADLVNSTTPGEAYEMAVILVQVMEDLYSRLEAFSLKEADQIYAEETMINMDDGFYGALDNPYNQYAERFNKELQRFPANVIKNIGNIQPLELYAERHEE